ncbi:uncharacterized protein LOC144627351 [Crassostrea virginica]
MDRYSSHILGLNEVYEKNAVHASAVPATQETFKQLRNHNQNQSIQKSTATQQHHHHHPNKPNYQQQQQNNQQQTQHEMNSQQAPNQQAQNMQQAKTQQQQSPTHFNLAQQHNNNFGFHQNQPTQQSLLSNLAQHQQFQQRALLQMMNVSPTQAAYVDPRFQTHQNPVGSSFYMHAPTPTVLSNYLPASTARSAMLNNRFTIQSGMASSRLSQGAGHTFSQSLSNPSQFAMSNVA